MELYIFPRSLADRKQFKTKIKEKDNISVYFWSKIEQFQFQVSRHRVSWHFFVFYLISSGGNAGDDDDLWVVYGRNGDDDGGNGGGDDNADGVQQSISYISSLQTWHS